MEGIRVQPRTASLVFDSAGRRVLSPKRNTRQDLTAYEMEVTPGSPSKSTRDIPDEAGKEVSIYIMLPLRVQLSNEFVGLCAMAHYW
jgi:hypothetical protein